MPSLHVLRRVKPQKKAVKNSTIIGILLMLLFLFPEYPKRLIYPFLFGQKTTEKLKISQDGNYEDVSPNIFNFTRNNYFYKLQPKTKYNITFPGTGLLLGQNGSGERFCFLHAVVKALPCGRLVSIHKKEC